MNADRLSTPGADDLIELRQAQEPDPAAANVTASTGAGCSGFSPCKSHRCWERPERRSGKQGRLLGRAVAGATPRKRGPLALPGPPSSAPPRTTGRRGRRPAERRPGQRPRAQPQPTRRAHRIGGPRIGCARDGPPGAPGSLPLACEGDCPAGCAEPLLRALNAPFPWLRPDPAPMARPVQKIRMVGRHSVS